MTSSQLRDLHFWRDGRSLTAARTAANRALQQLWHGGYVERQRAALISHRGLAFQGFVNVLTEEGWAALDDYYAQAGGERPETNRGEVGPGALRHAVTLNDLYVTLACACRSRGVAFPFWLDDRRLLALKREHQVGLVAIPDAAFGLRAPGHTLRLLFLELDLHTESVWGLSASPRNWVGKIAGYERYFREGFAKEKLFAGFARPIVLTITTSEEHLENLAVATAETAGELADSYWFATRDAIDPEIIELTAKQRENRGPEEPRGARVWERSWVTPAGERRSLWDVLTAANA